MFETIEMEVLTCLCDFEASLEWTIDESQLCKSKLVIDAFRATSMNQKKIQSEKCW